MGLGHSPRIVTDGLVLSLDAGSPKNYNVGISTNWTDKIGGNNGTLVGGTNHTDGPFVGAGYVEFDGTGDYLSIPNSSDFAFGTGDFTVEMWVYSTNTVGGLVAADQTSVGSTYWASLIFGNSLYWQSANGFTNLFSTSYASYINKWTYVAFVRNSGTTTLYLDGVSITSASDTTDYNGTSGNLDIGRDFDNNSYLTGKISNLRIVKGTALYTSNFTPPTGPLTAVTNTTLLTCQGNTIADASSSAHSISVTGGAEANLGFPKSAFEFDGSNYDYILSAANPTLNWGTGDFTVEMWVNVSSSTSFGTLFSTEVNAQQAQENTFVISMNSSLQLKVTTYSTVLISASSATAISANTWTHIVVTRQGTTLTLYIDKSSAGTATSSINYVAGGYTTGALPRSLSNTNFTGKVSNVRVYKGKALTVAEIEQNYNATKGRYGF